MVNRFSTIRSANDGAQTGAAGNKAPSHADRVHLEMFRAIEALGRKLERAEEERDRLTRRLALIESAATLDEKTGKFYLPALLEPGAMPPQQYAATPKWAIATSLLSVGIALFSLSVVMLQPATPQLTKQQLAAIDAITATRFTSLDTGSWKEVAAGEAQKTEERADSTAITEPPSIPALEMMETASGAAEEVVEEAPAAVETVKTETLPVEKAAETIPALVQAQMEEEKTAAVVEPEAPATRVKREPPRMAGSDVPEIKLGGDAETVNTIAADPHLSTDVKQLETRAFEGVAAAQHDLATLYAAGRSVQQDYKRAVYWFSRAADGGVANAHYNLGVMFQQGLGVKKDMKKAIGWYRSAAELGHPEAMYNLGIAYIEGVGASRNIERGAAYFRRSAEAGVAQAAFNLGVLYESNFIGAIDLDQALDWYRKAEGLGHADAAAAVQRVSQQRSSAMAAGNADIEPAAGN